MLRIIFSLISTIIFAVLSVEIPNMYVVFLYIISLASLVYFVSTADIKE